MENALFTIIYIHLIIAYGPRCFIRLHAANRAKADSKSVINTVMRIFAV